MVKEIVDNIFNAETYEPITELTINEIPYKAKGTFKFDIKAKQFAKKNDKGEVEGTGFHEIYNGLLNRNPEAIVQFWVCAIAHYKVQPSQEEVQEAVEKVIEEKEDTLQLLQGAVEVLNESGFFKQQTKMFWFQMNQAPKLVKKDEKEEAQNALAYMKETYVTLTNKQPY